MVKNFFRKTLCLALILSILAPQVVYATKSSPAVLFRNKNHFEPEQSAADRLPEGGDKFPSFDRGEFTDANTPAGVTTYDYDLNGNLGRITDANRQHDAFIKFSIAI